MTELKNPARGNNTFLSEISTTLAMRLDYLRQRFGIDGPTATLICELAMGAYCDGGGE